MASCTTVLSMAEFSAVGVSRGVTNERRLGIVSRCRTFDDRRMSAKKEARGLLTASLNLNKPAANSNDSSTAANLWERVGFAFLAKWARLESNQHALAGTRPSTLRVCQFRHEPLESGRPRRFPAARNQIR
jgi:hypothetical protein